MTMLYGIPMRLLMILCCLFVFASCGPPVRQQAPETQVHQEQQARDLLSAGNFIAAAEEYIRLAEQNKRNSVPFILNTGQLIPAARTRIELNNYLLTVQELAENQQTIWRLLSQSDANALAQELGASTGKPTQDSWLELAIISKTHIYKPHELEIAIQSWKKRYPDHPAAIDIINGIYAVVDQANKQPGKIALLLPFNAQYKERSEEHTSELQSR